MLKELVRAAGEDEVSGRRAFGDGLDGRDGCGVGSGAIQGPAMYAVAAVVVDAEGATGEHQGAVVAACYNDAVRVGVGEDLEGIDAACVDL